MENRNFKDSCGTSFDCSTVQLLERELKYLEKVFHEKKNYPKYIVKQILNKDFEEHSRENATNTTFDEQNETEHTTKRNIC